MSSRIGAMKGAAVRFSNYVKKNKGKTALGIIAVLALTGIGLAFGLNATRPAMLHFFGKIVRNAYNHGKIAPLVTAAVGGVLLGSGGAIAFMKHRQEKSPTPAQAPSGHNDDDE